MPFTIRAKKKFFKNDFSLILAIIMRSCRFPDRWITYIGFGQAQKLTPHVAYPIVDSISTHTCLNNLQAVLNSSCGKSFFLQVLCNTHFSFFSTNHSTASILRVLKKSSRQKLAYKYNFHSFFIRKRSFLHVHSKKKFEFIMPFTLWNEPIMTRPYDFLQLSKWKIS